MRRFRTQWLAVFGALVILSLSLSSAFGAPPKGEGDETTFGQQVSAFVHSLQSGDEDGNQDECGTDEEPGDTDEEAADESGAEDGDEAEDAEDGDEAENAEDGDQADETEEAADACDTDESADEDTQQDEPEDQDPADASANSHGQCVAAVAAGDDVGENDTHGWAVSEAARVTCWEDAADGAAKEDAGDSADAENTGAGNQHAGDHGKPSLAGLNAGGNGHGRGGPHQ